MNLINLKDGNTLTSLESEAIMNIDILVGNPRKIFKKIYKGYNSNNLITTDELYSLFTDSTQLQQDLNLLYELKLISSGLDSKYRLTADGRMYFKLEIFNLLRVIFKSIFVLLL